MSAWSTEVMIEIDNTGNASALTDYQVMMTINTQALIAANKLESDGRDLRFTETQDDDTTLMDYWFEAGTLNTTATNVWVKVPTIPASSVKTVYMYYGNAAAAAASDGSSTFDFFDDFDAYDDAVWEKTHVSSSVSNSRLRVNYGSVYTENTVAATTHDQLVESKLRWLTSSGSYSGMMIGNDHATQGSNGGADALIYYMTQSSNGDMSVYYWAADGTQTGYNLGAATLFTAAVGTDYIAGYVIRSNNTISFLP